MLKNVIKRTFSIFIILIILIQVSACTNGNIKEESNNGAEKPKMENDNKDNKKTDYTEENAQLKRLLPQREDYKWIYSGFAEYGHQMDLKSITELEDRTIYSVNGKIFDPSGGEAKGNFNLEIIYTIKDGELIQTKREEKMMDSIFNSLTLIKTPLEEGNKWDQKLEDEDGNKYKLRCFIEDIKEENGKKVYSVRYEDTKGDYYEKREIKEGVGVISFERLYKGNEENFTIGYSLYGKASGYNNYLNMKKYLPPLEKRLVYHGLAEYGHSGVLRKVSEDETKAIYEFLGDYEDGSGLGGEFKVLYTLNYQNGTVTEEVISNTRTDEKRVNSILKNLIILKLPIETGNRWFQNIEIDGKEYLMEGKIIDISYKDQSYYPIGKIDEQNPIVKVRYIVKDIEGYFNNTYIEERQFEAGRGLIAFSKLMKGDIPVSGKELEDYDKVNEAIMQRMFGYGLSYIRE
ncbi:hypothetical protein [Thermohalobacter berrensis]|uniref:Uncharacterized protein n=1 Tax=Thermohalobacter berrensis TaxID=99594 RepID=A0A419SU39_9FIRM|nr:hypothetical protein [Thermohalobacter berrensis]RKD28793.1 hypothetical protein BET03_07085 [Thermohalobacter berrensis]